MSGQTKRHSVYETVASTAIGFTVSYILNLLVVPLLFNVHPTPGQNITMVSLFTIASLIRGYWTRRLFNWIHLKTRVSDPNEYSYQPQSNPPSKSPEGWLAKVQAQHPGSMWAEGGLYIPPEKKD